MRADHKLNIFINVHQHQFLVEESHIRDTSMAAMIRGWINMAIAERGWTPAEGDAADTSQPTISEAKELEAVV